MCFNMIFRGNITREMLATFASMDAYISRHFEDVNNKRNSRATNPTSNMVCLPKILPMVTNSTNGYYHW